MSKSKQLVFIDDSGDSGLKKSSTPQFVVAAVSLVDQESLERLRIVIHSFRAGLGWDELHELKFNTAKKSIIKDLLGLVGQLDFKCYAAAVDKKQIMAPPKLVKDETLYNYAIKELLLKIKLTSGSTIVIDGVAFRKHAEKTRTYLRKALKEQGVAGCKIKFVDSRKDVLVQLADIVAGSVARSYDKKKTDSSDYVRLLGKKLKIIYEIDL